MLAEEAHYMGEPCYHVVQYYERKRRARLAQKHIDFADRYGVRGRNVFKFGRVYK